MKIDELWNKIEFSTLPAHHGRGGRGGEGARRKGFWWLWCSPSIPNHRLEDVDTNFICAVTSYLIFLELGGAKEGGEWVAAHVVERPLPTHVIHRMMYARNARFYNLCIWNRILSFLSPRKKATFRTSQHTPKRPFHPPSWVSTRCGSKLSTIRYNDPGVPAARCLIEGFAETLADSPCGNPFGVVVLVPGPAKKALIIKLLCKFKTSEMGIVSVSVQRIQHHRLVGTLKD